MSKSSNGKIRLLAAVMMLCVLFAAGSGTAVYAASGIESGRTATLTIQPQYDGENVSGGTFSVYLIAVITDYDALEYELVHPFNQSSVDINKIKSSTDIMNATDILKEYISEVDPEDVITASGGETLTGLRLGIYLVVNTDIGGSYIEALPFLAFLPIYEDGAWAYGYTAYPKLDLETTPPPGPGPSPPPGPGPAPGPNVPTPAGVTLSENQTPAGVYTPPSTTTIDGEETPAGVSIPETVTIEPELTPLDAPQTGMLQWPVPVLGALGCALTGSGIFVGREKKENEE